MGLITVGFGCNKHNALYYGILISSHIMLMASSINLTIRMAPHSISISDQYSHAQEPFSI